MKINIVFPKSFLWLITLSLLVNGASAAENVEGKKVDKIVSNFVETYKGKCVEGNCQNGKGTVMYSDGSNYTGNFRDNMRNGYGIYIYIKGPYHDGIYKYEGEFENDLYHGKGTFTSLDGNSCYTGDYVKGTREGKGVWVLSEGRYEGEWKGGLFHGTGTFYYPNGDIYEGLWVEGKKNND